MLTKEISCHLLLIGLVGKNFYSYTCWSVGVLLNQRCKQRWPFEQCTWSLIFLCPSYRKTTTQRSKSRKMAKNLEVSNVTKRSAMFSFSPSKDLPSSTTRTRSQSITVGIRWAIVIIVQFAKSSRIIPWMTASVWESTEAVASSMKRILLFLSMTLPKQRSCLCPTLQLSPLSTTGESSFSGFAATTSFNWHRSRL